MTVAVDIFEQIGGYKFIAMTGAYNLCSDNKSLSMHLKGRKTNLLTITLDEHDTYIMHFRKYKESDLTVKDVAKFEGVYAEDLQRIFTETTGLLTNLF